jgi:hypothetical protein
MKRLSQSEKRTEKKKKERTKERKKERKKEKVHVIQIKVRRRVRLSFCF